MNRLLTEDGFLQLYNAIPSAIFTVDTDRVLTSVNENAARLFGYSAQEMVGKKCAEFCFGPCVESCKLFDDGLPKVLLECEGIIRRFDGMQRIVAKRLSLLKDKTGEVIGGLEIIEDITEQKELEEILKDTEERYHTLYESASSPVLVTDTKGNYIDCNDAACGFFECSREALLAMNVVDTLPNKHGKKLKELKKEVVKEGIVEADFIIKNRVKVLELTVTPSVWQGRKVIVGVGKDVTERKQAEAKIMHMAYHDILTGFPNRALFKEKLGTAINAAAMEGRRLAVLFLDLDRFKNVNDTFGHDCGDKLLKDVAVRLRRCIRLEDTVARLSGDEFIILLTGIEKAAAAIKVSQKIINAIKEPFEIVGRGIHITASIGIAVFPEDGDTEKILMQNADTAMYRAKERGGNISCLYTLAMNERVVARLELENSLREALKKEELMLYYQPKVDSSTGTVMGVEALLRWQHPSLGLIKPLDFIPLAEETGLIIPIGEWVIENACKQNMEWQMKGFPPIRVSVNISAIQFQQGALVSKVARVLKETGLAPHCLELEITESTAMQNLTHTINVVNNLKKLGVKISIDDFGTGHASLSYLKLFPPIDTLKIDRSFVRDIPEEKDNASSALVATMIVLAKNLKLKVVAEGVENEKQLEFLQHHQCDQIQGYLFSRPVDADAFEDFLRCQPFKRENQKGIGGLGSR